MDRSQRRPSKRPKQSEQSVIRTRAAKAREEMMTASEVTTEPESASKAETETEADSPEMTVEEWTSAPVVGECGNCAGPGEGGVYCPACRQLFLCAACADSELYDRHFTEGGCAYEEQWEALGMPTWRKVPAPQKRLGDPQTE